MEIPQWVFFLADILKSFENFAVTLDCFVPHRCRSHPNIAVAIQSTIYYHFFTSFAMLCYKKHFVLVAFEVAVFSEFYFAQFISPSFLLLTLYKRIHTKVIIFIPFRIIRYEPHRATFVIHFEINR